MAQRLSPGCYYGQTLKKYETAGVLLTESAYLPHTLLKQYSHANPYFCLTLSGGYDEVYGDKRRGCKPSSLGFHPANEIHANRFLDDGGRLFGLELKNSWVERVRPYSLVLENSSEVSGGQLVYLITRLYRECQHSDSVPRWRWKDWLLRL